MFTIEHKYQGFITKITLLESVEVAEITALAAALFNNINDAAAYILTDARAVNYSFSRHDFEQINELTKSFRREETMLYEALIIGTPREMGLSMLYAEFAPIPNHEISFFSTEAPAVLWLRAMQGQQTMKP